MNTMNIIQNIAAIYAESAEAAQKREIDRHAELFKLADAEFKALIDSDSSLHNCELRDIRYTIVQGNFNDAKARYSEPKQLLSEALAA